MTGIKKISERELILSTFLEITDGGEYSHIALRQVLEKYQYLEKKERAFITRVIEGTLERMITIDYILNQYSKVKVTKMKPVIRGILRTAVYQIYYMDSVPDSAACNEAVKLAVKKGFQNLRGFVNGVLRAVIRGKDTIKWPEKSDELRWLSVHYSIPEWIAGKWLSAYGRERTEQMLADSLAEHPTSIRCNLEQITPEELKKELEESGIHVKINQKVSYAMLIDNYDYIGDIRAFRAGKFHVQDVSSMFVAEAADPKENDFVMDVCAAPGGKALHVAEKLHGTGLVEARDLSEYKVSLIEDNIHRSGLKNIRAVCADATVPDSSMTEKADIVIADLPCSGLGVLAKKTDLKYRMSEKQQDELVTLQRRILGTVWHYVRPGGTLVYSTCTVNRSENEENASWFSSQFPFEKLEEKQYLPGIDGGDGFYIAKFRRDV